MRHLSRHGFYKMIRLLFYLFSVDLNNADNIFLKKILHHDVKQNYNAVGAIEGTVAVQTSKSIKAASSFGDATVSKQLHKQLRSKHLNKLCQIVFDTFKILWIKLTGYLCRL